VDSDKKKLCFAAKLVSLEDDGYATTAAFSDDADAPEHYVILQFANAPTDVDVRLGQDRLHIEIHPSGISGYNLLQSLSLSQTILRLLVRLPADKGFFEVEVDLAQSGLSDTQIREIISALESRLR
jgi:hypothetical protein